MRTVEVVVEILPDGRLNAVNAARYLGLATRTLTTMRCYGEGPKFVKRGKVFYFKKDLDAWINAGRAKGGKSSGRSTRRGRG